MPARKNIVLDSFALIGYLENETFSDRIEKRKENNMKKLSLIVALLLVGGMCIMAAGTEVLAGAHDAGAEHLLPEAVDRDPGGQRVVRIHQPSRE